ncbi:MAG: magnesium transporter [Kiritimatiellae bacterium]|nr:magnesium transporter [Kiritimatiellia bacterium]
MSEQLSPTAEAADRRERLDELVYKELWGQIASELGDMPPADVAELLSHYGLGDLVHLFKALPEDQKPDVMAELPSDLGAALAEALPVEAAADIVNEMAPDDAADVLGEVGDKEVSSKIIEGMDEENAADVSRLMTYPEDSAGGIMTTDLVEVPASGTVRDALDAVAASDEDDEHVYQVFVVDPSGRLLGTVSIQELLRHKEEPATPLSLILDEDTHAVRSDADQQEVAEIMAKYDLPVVPVVDGDGRLLGRITHDDATDIIREEAEEDLLAMAGASDEEIGNVSAWRSCFYRLPWLLITLLGGVVTASIMSSFQSHFALVIVLAAFIPNVMGMGGNTGLQSSVLMIREIASGSGRRHSLGRLFLHELRTGALMGLICGAGIFLCALAIMFATPSGRAAIATAADKTALTAACAPFAVASVAGLALFCAMTFAAGFGAVVPIVLDRLKIDTAVASGPFISVMDDISALLIYYGVSLALLARILPQVQP